MYLDCESSLNSIVNDDWESLLVSVERNGGSSGENELIDDNGIDPFEWTWLPFEWVWLPL